MFLLLLFSAVDSASRRLGRAARKLFRRMARVQTRIRSLGARVLVRKRLHSQVCVRTLVCYFTEFTEFFFVRVCVCLLDWPRLTHENDVVLRVELWDFNDTYVYADYESFR